jgi:NAD(P)-dependent dehydrogenase (short-subunit alcohol dehydrogenase family)
VINISSIAAELGVPAMTLYAGTKSGARGITRGFAAALAPDGVTVNSVSPGLTRVGRTEGVIDEHGDQLFDFDRIPLGRIGEPRDTADVCVFLASDLAGYVTGVDILVDGGVAFTAGLYK